MMVRGHRYVEFEDHITVGTSFEVWNRRRYPIVVRKLQITLKNVKAKEVKQVFQTPIKPGWVVGWNGARIELFDQQILGPNEHVAFEIDATCDMGDEYVHEPGMTVRASIYDPIRDAHRVLEQTARQWGDSPTHLL